MKGGRTCERKALGKEVGGIVEVSKRGWMLGSIQL